jgi:hypothetical protein
MGVDGGLVSLVVPLLARLFEHMAGRVGERAADELTDATITKASRLYEAIMRRLTDRDIATLDELERQPAREDLRREAAAVIERLLDDPAGGSELAALARDALGLAGPSIAGNVTQTGVANALGDQAITFNDSPIDFHPPEQAGRLTTPGDKSDDDAAAEHEHPRTARDVYQSGLFNALRDQFIIAIRVEQERRRAAPPRQLPPAPIRFYDRYAEARRLLRLLAHRDGATPVVVIVGPPGVGKSALGLQVGHKLAAESYPDMQLFVPLSQLEGPVISAREALGRILEELGVEHIPDELSQREALYRSELAGKRVLLMLDGVISAEQVRPLQPPPGCGVLITAHRELRGLMVDGAERLPLRPFSRRQSLAFLVDRLGRNRVTAEPRAAFRLATLCGGMPLALAVVAAELKVESGRFRSLRDAAIRLEHEWTRLQHLEAEDRSVTAALRFRVGLLTDQQRRLLLLAGLLDLVVLDLELLAAADDVNPDIAAGLLDELVDAGLVEQVGRDRWRLHDLVRLYARQAAYEQLTKAEREAALGRALEVEAARARAMLELAIERDAAAAERLRAWLEIDRPNLAGLLEQATEAGVLGLADELASWIEILLEALTNWPDRIRVDRARLEVARRAQDAWLEAWILHGIGVSHARAGHYAQAAALLQQSLTLAARTGDSRLQEEIGRDLGALPTWHDDPAGVVLGRPAPATNLGVSVLPTVAAAAIARAAPSTIPNSAVPAGARETEGRPSPELGPSAGDRPDPGGAPRPDPRSGQPRSDPGSGPRGSSPGSGPGGSDPGSGPGGSNPNPRSGPRGPSGSGSDAGGEPPGGLGRAKRAVAAARGSGAAPQAPLIFGEPPWPRS